MLLRSPSPIKRVVIIILITLMLIGLYQFSFLIRVVWYSHYNPSSSAVMRQTLSELRQEDPKATIRYGWVDYDQISNHLKRAVVSSEDANFFEHNGVEWEAIRQAWDYNKQQASQGSDRRRGGSTLTQQLAKNLFLSNKRSYSRKAQELILSLMIEMVMSKQRILELYLNIAQWGAHDFGAQAAAKHYFNTTANKLNTTQSARLAAILPNPIFYDHHGNTAYLQRRTHTISQRMRLITLP